LLETTDRGATFRRVELGRRVLAVSPGSPPVCLVEVGESVRLLRSAPSGGFAATGGEWTFESERVDLVAAGDIVSVLEQGRGVRVSADGGATFHVTAGTARATAIAAGRLGGRRSVFAALFDANSGRSALVWIDATCADARTIAEILPDLGEDQEDDWAKIDALTWDPSSETLWAAGSFGVRRWRRPPSA
jgi:hypothetical protein